LVKRFTHDRLAPGMPGPLLHGGAVATADGATVLVIGPSGTGKSTLVAHLAHAGCELINDEQVSVHVEAGLLGGFTRPIDVKAGGVEHLPPVDGSTSTRDGRGAFVTARQLGTRHRSTG
jgi:serine kinase of HPr protein (carbohydrate metabolism regulator)